MILLLGDNLCNNQEVFMKIRIIFCVLLAAVLYGCAATGNHYEYGMQYYESGKLDEAIEEFQASIAIYPSDPVVQKALGDVFADKGLLLDAVERWEVALRLRPAYEEVSGKLEASYLTLAKEEEDKGKLDDAIDIWKRAIALNNNNIEAHKKLGLAYLTKKDNASAIPELEFTIDKNPSDDLVYKKLGMAYFAVGNMDGAVRSFETLIRIKPTDAAAQNNLGSILIKMKKFDEAADVLKRAIKLAPDEVAILNNLGSAYYGKNDYKNARAQWSRANEIKPMDKTARENITTLNAMGE
jgi:tetratricopeptide (TPR) repeat protein